MSIPGSLRYTSDHEWVDMRDSVARVGITDYAQDALGDVVFVQLPIVGSAAVAGDAFGEVESTKSVSDVFAPVNGTVVAVNERLAEQPELLNADPYGEGWLCEIDITNADTTPDLLDAAAYRALVGD
jgi:glycine cleavage system H protein